MSYAFNPFTGNFDLTKPDNFSYNEVILGSVLYIPQYQQMITFGELLVHGDLLMDGDLVLI